MNIIQRILSIVQRVVFNIRTGTDIVTLNDGKPVDEIVIRYKDFFFGIMLDVETGEPTGDFVWSEDSGMFYKPVREHLIAKEQDESN